MVLGFWSRLRALNVRAKVPQYSDDGSPFPSLLVRAYLLIELVMIKTFLIAGSDVSPIH